MDAEGGPKLIVSPPWNQDDEQLAEIVLRGLTKATQLCIDFSTETSLDELWKLYVDLTKDSTCDVLMLINRALEGLDLNSVQITAAATFRLRQFLTE